MNEIASYETFRNAWQDDVLAGNPTTTEKARRFSAKIVADWLDADGDTLDITYCDGAGDGGIDVAILERGSLDEDGVPSGDTWYLVQSKYGKAFAGDSTLVEEGLKVIDTLDGKRANLSSLAEGLLEKLSNFRASAGESDRIVLLFATVDPLTDMQRMRLQDVQQLGQARLGTSFDVQAVSIKTIHDALVEEEKLAAERRLTVPLSGHLANAGNDLLVGSVKLTALYQFLKDYRAQTSNNLDQLYEKNVRKFLGGKVKINRVMQETLRGSPEQFGLFNNGITIVVSDFTPTGSGSYDLVEPFVVNGCQTTRTIWEVCDKRLNAGGTALAPEIEEWRQRADRGCVVVKIAKVGPDGEQLLQNITRYTNSQNAVRDKDFIALESGFKGWKDALATKYGVYLEVQRGGWDSQRAFQKQNPSSAQFHQYANALDLLKVYGSGWFSEPGLAFGKNPPFLPGGSVYLRILATPDGAKSFGADDLHAAYLLMKQGEQKEFGRGGPPARRQTKFLFYFVAVNLLRDVLHAAGRPTNHSDVSSALNKLLRNESNGGKELINNATNLIDAYMNKDDPNSFANEPAFTEDFNFDLNAFLKWEQLGRSIDKTPKLQQILHFQKMFMKQSQPGGTSAQDLILKDL